MLLPVVKHLHALYSHFWCVQRRFIARTDWNKPAALFCLSLIIPAQKYILIWKSQNYRNGLPVCWIELAHNNVQSWASVNTGMNICLIRARNCLTSFQLLNEGLVLGGNWELFKVNFIETKGRRWWGLDNCIVMCILQVLWPVMFATGLLEDGNVARRATEPLQLMLLEWFALLWLSRTCTCTHFVFVCVFLFNGSMITSRRGQMN